MDSNHYPNAQVSGAERARPVPDFGARTYFSFSAQATTQRYDEDLRLRSEHRQPGNTRPGTESSRVSGKLERCRLSDRILVQKAGPSMRLVWSLRIHVHTLGGELIHHRSS
ncbi:hypothetical protein PSHT_13742 [Puccinia striiformis]|uniref:Uncharacterized protein n=2 Tax=Puccinia striiformis TaxID=27350 RepID=A0A0L0V0R8_9BASI|nr:hypothetical protein Pst134EB_002348 [Puccinia striiformis f. sp. tritici]KAI9625023.1 hypothetical protein H4Q26_016591 [Puccinia striiformis f. sp. tritici PST-130]KNE92875.1 hypothetical protein PSTG_13724 [Puccinia striiformis f. sp. tritici PST-78]POV99245.1 hypothetical protein PSHT_13742 [Puccinia striiformis]